MEINTILRKLSQDQAKTVFRISGLCYHIQEAVLQESDHHRLTIR